MYRIPSEFLKSKNTLFGPITMEVTIGAAIGFFVGQIPQALGLEHPAWAGVPTILGFILTFFKFKGLPLYKFAQLYSEFLLRYFSDNAITPPEMAEEIQTVDVAIYDEHGQAIIFAEVD